MKARLIVTPRTSASGTLTLGDETLTSGDDVMDRAAAGGPAENMAIDQALLQSVDQADQDSIITLRLYQWNCPTLSLGYFQNYGDRIEHGPSSSLACVRRASGGGAIVHHHELTYSLIVRDGNRTTKPGANQWLYQQTHACFVKTLQTFGLRAQPFSATARARQGLVSAAISPSVPPSPFLCFQRRTAEDLIVSGYKVLGSAQRRGRRTILQHGSLLVRTSPHAACLPGIIELGAHIREVQQILTPVIQAFSKQFSVQWHEDGLSEQERRSVESIRQTRFANEKWNLKR